MGKQLSHSGHAHCTSLNVTPVELVSTRYTMDQNLKKLGTESQGTIRDILEQLQKGIRKVSEKVETLNAFCGSKKEQKF